ncbi:hypothetical protein [Ramlibacter sp.]|uniref:hypothetical protein n=1 Tax=Ramlibacter sp. TaxID=1917967 RepID=UPI002D462CE0|nr:hypothetical protein [Ramlibacter sp.]HYD74685.1 hypothetical protein [Ramlibacter sp.]
MRTLVLILGLMLAGAAWATNCPNEMKEIDAKLQTKPQLSKADADKVAKLRADGEKFHKEGKHAESMAALTEAKKILGI